MDRLMTPEETARRLRCSLALVYAFSSRGTLPKVKIGNKLLFRESDVERYIVACQIDARSPVEVA